MLNFSGLGLLMARALAANGAKAVYILGRRLPNLQAAAASCPEGTLRPIVCDVVSKPSLEAAAKIIEQEVGYVNLVVANAGHSGPPSFQIPTKANGGTIKGMKEFLWNQDAAGHARQYETHVTASLWTSLAFLELLDKGNRVGYGNAKLAAKSESRTLFGGSNGPDVLKDFQTVDANGTLMPVTNGIPKSDPYVIVNGETEESVPTTRPDQSLFTTATSAVTSQVLAISSVQGINKNAVAGFAYGASKAAQIHLSRMLAVQLEPFGIRSNVLAPGFFPSELTADIIASKFQDGLPRWVTPMERAGKEEEMAGTVIWLAGRSGAYCNGSLIVLDGGRMLVNPSVA
jgi:NAD(P)-dependent dehydrogenase (short-subunit alcohol dehydrogenase family)